MNKRTIKKKIEQGFAECGWTIHNGLGSRYWNGGGSWAKALKLLMEYLDEKEKKAFEDGLHSGGVAL